MMIIRKTKSQNRMIQNSSGESEKERVCRRESLSESTDEPWMRRTIWCLVVDFVEDGRVHLAAGYLS